MRPFLLMAFAAAFALPATAQSPRVGVGLRAGLDLPSVEVTWNASPRLTLRAAAHLWKTTETPQYLYSPIHLDALVEGGAEHVREATRAAGLTAQFNLLPEASVRSYLGFSGRYVSRVTRWRQWPCDWGCAPDMIGPITYRMHSSHVRLGATAGAEVPVWRGLHVSGELGYFGAVLPLSGDMEWMFDNRATATFGLAYFVR